MSSYISPAPQGDPKATGAYAIAIAETPGGTNMAGHPTDSAGNVQVDRVWGNFPLQPNDERTDTGTSFGGGAGDHGWSPTYYATSDTLRTTPYTNNTSVQDLFNITPKTPADSHTIATTGYSNFPQYIPNYAGDGDTGLEVAVPNLVRQTLTAAQVLLDPLELDLFPNAHTLTVTHLKTTGKTVRVTASDTDVANWGAGYPGGDLIGLRVGDMVSAALTVDGHPFNFTDAIVTKVNVNGVNSYFEFEQVAATEPAIDFAATGTVYAGTNLVDVVTLQRRTIVNEGQQVNVRYFAD
jgi:hypothetical protein